MMESHIEVIEGIPVHFVDRGVAVRMRFHIQIDIPGTDRSIFLNGADYDRLRDTAERCAHKVAERAS